MLYNVHVHIACTYTNAHVPVRLSPLAFSKNLSGIYAHTRVSEPTRGLVPLSQMWLLGTAARCVTRRWTDKTK